ncbi:MAG: hypothetical protein WC683_12620 [bacterium]
MAHLWTAGPLPARYLQYVACAYLYHCTPDVAQGIPLDTVLLDYECWQAEKRVRPNGG